MRRFCATSVGPPCLKLECLAKNPANSAFSKVLILKGINAVFRSGQNLGVMAVRDMAHFVLNRCHTPLPLSAQTQSLVSYFAAGNISVGFGPDTGPRCGGREAQLAFPLCRMRRAKRQLRPSGC